MIIARTFLKSGVFMVDLQQIAYKEATRIFDKIFRCFRQIRHVYNPKIVDILP